jgi:serine/threonine protein kinase
MKICSECQRCYDDVVEQCSEWHGSLAHARQGSVSMITGYRIEECLYTGLRGDLFRATRIDCGRSCLIRIVTADEERAKTFLNEAKVIADLYHPNLTAVFESGTTEVGEVFVVSEDPKEGETLRDWLDRRQHVELLESIRIVRVIAETLHELHVAGVIFRALDPRNILISNVEADEVNIRLQNIDLGGAAQHAIISNKFLIDTETAAIRYFSPEQCADERATARSDVYSLGVLLYELIAGVPPFDAGRAAGVIEQHRHARPPEIKIGNFDLRMLISHTLMESLSKRPELRQASADLFARQLRHIEQLATHVSTPAPVVKTLTAFPKPSPRLITLAEMGLDLTEPEALSSAPMVPESSSVVSESKDQPATVPVRRRVTIHPETAVPSSPTGKVDPDGIKQIDFRAARERMKHLLATPAASNAAPKLIRPDEQFNDIPSVDDTLEVLRSEGDPSREFRATAEYQSEVNEPSDNVDLFEPVKPDTVSAASPSITQLDLVPTAPTSVENTFQQSSAADQPIFTSIGSLSAVRFANLRRGIAIAAAAGLIGLAFTFRADIVETFTPFDLGKLEPPQYKGASSVAEPTRQTSEITYTPPVEYEVPESATVVDEQLPTAVTMRGVPKSSEARPVARRLSDNAPEARLARPTPLKPRPEQYKPETLVITYPDSKNRKASNERDPFVKPKSGAGMTRPRIVANPKP